MTGTGSAPVLRRVLVATDFTQGAAAALDRALALPLGPEARVELLHILQPEDSREVEVRARERLDAEVHRVAARALERGVTIVPTCLRGQGFIDIVRTARASAAELIVIGVHGVRPIRDRFVGSTATRVIRKADTPVLLVRQPGNGSYANVLVAAALGDSDRRLFDLALQVAGAAKQRAVVHAVRVPYEGFTAPTAGARAGLRRAYCDEAAAKVRGMVEQLGTGVPWDVAVGAGDVTGVILEEAIARGAELLVVGTHARSGIAHALLGSVAENVITAAPCDVLVARPVRFTFELP